MNNTTHYELKKPEATDFYNIDDFNDNADLIDTLIYEHGEGAEQESSPAGTDFLQLIGGSDSKLYKALISDIADTVLRKLAISTSETGLASGSVIEKINSLNGKTNIAYSAATNTGAFEQSICKIGQFVVGSIIFRPTADISADNGLIATTSDISVTNAFQLPLICTAGTQEGKTGRVMIYQDTIKAWYSNVQPKSGNTYLIPIVAITNL